MTTYIFIDGSYFVFYRFHAVLSWWKLRYPETFQTVSASPAENPEFVAQFRKLSVACIANITACCNKIGGDDGYCATDTDTKVYIAKDCPRKNIWRMSFYGDYKGTRTKCDGIAPFFELFYQSIVADMNILSHPSLEADDCIALTCMALRDKDPIGAMFIVASDNDYLQLLRLNNIYITDLTHMTTKLMSIKRAFTDDEKQKAIRANSSSGGASVGASGGASVGASVGASSGSGASGAVALLKKILLGDKSDNIMPVFDAAAIRKLSKTVSEDVFVYFNNNPEQLTAELTRANKLQEYDLNRRLIDFSFIPDQYKIEFLQTKGT